MSTRCFSCKNMSTRCFSCLTDYCDFLQEEKKHFDDKYNKNVSSDKNVDDFEMITVLGIGSFGRVVLVREKPSESTYYASKIMSKKHLVNTGQVNHTLTEKRILQSINFSFTVDLKYFFMDNSYLYFVMPYVAGGELFNLYQNIGLFLEKEARFYAAQVIYALEYLHNLDIIYRDLKPENILIDDKGYIKLTDFGLSKVVVGRTYTLCGTPDYIAPEIISNKGYGKAVDFWSLGVLIYELCAGYPPFLAPDLLQLYEMICAMNYSMPETFTDELQDLVKYLIHTDITRRLGNLVNGIEDIKKHKWFEDLDWLAILNYTVKAPHVPIIISPDDTENFELPYISDELQVSQHNLYKNEFSDF